MWDTGYGGNAYLMGPTFLIGFVSCIWRILTKHWAAADNPTGWAQWNRTKMNKENILVSYLRDPRIQGLLVIIHGTLAFVSIVVYVLESGNIGLQHGTAFQEWAQERHFLLTTGSLSAVLLSLIYALTMRIVKGPDEDEVGAWTLMDTVRDLKERLNSLRIVTAWREREDRAKVRDQLKRLGRK